MRRGCLTAIVVIGLAVLLAAWVALTHPPADEHMIRWTNDLRARLMPPDASELSQTPIQRKQWSAHTSWEFATPQRWPEFAEWARGRLAPEYVLLRAPDELTIIASRTLPGDALNVRIETAKDGPPLRVRVTFQATAD